METLEEIKNEVAKKYSKHTTWDEMMNYDFEYGAGASKYYSKERLWEEVCTEYSDTYKTAFLNLSKACEMHLGKDSMNGLLVSGSYGRTDLDLQELYEELQ